MIAPDSLKWHKRYLDVAREVAKWSKDPSTQTATVIVGRSGQILSQGYNGFPRGLADTEERLNNRIMKYQYVVHGEMNAIFNACLSGVSLEGSTLYTVASRPLSLCAECAKGIIQVGVSHVVVEILDGDIPDRWVVSTDLARSMFDEAGVKVTVIHA